MVRRERSKVEMPARRAKTGSDSVSLRVILAFSAKPLKLAVERVARRRAGHA
jgi:hypothetical protein